MNIRDEISRIILDNLTKKLTPQQAEDRLVELINTKVINKIKQEAQENSFWVGTEAVSRLITEDWLLDFLDTLT